VSRFEIKLIDNGKDGILFLHCPENEPFTFLSAHEKNIELFKKIIIDKINFQKDYLDVYLMEYVIKFWFYSIPFLTMLPTKPILLIHGPKGSGKSLLAKLFGILLFGRNFNITPFSNNQKNFDSVITNKLLACFDNIDTPNKWVCDKLATVATGGSLKKRQLYSTNSLKEYPINCFLVLTSRNVFFNRDDVTDRLLVIKTQRFTEFISEKIIIDEILKYRNILWTEIIHNLQTCIKSLYNNRNKVFKTEFRLADFATFAFKVFDKNEKFVADLFMNLAKAQSSFAIESDTAIELLLLWAENNYNREITSSDLCSELTILAEKKRKYFPFKNNQRGFAQYLKNIRENLKPFLNISYRNCGGRKRLYKFIPRSKENIFNN
jgi:hypothetical protein